MANPAYSNSGLSGDDPLGLMGEAPEPLPEKRTAPPYPVKSLGNLLGDAAEAMAYHIQAPVSIAGQSVLAAAALLAQGHVNVRRGNISGADPVSLYFMSVLQSGDRKSSLDKVALSFLREHEQELRQQDREARASYKAELTAWEKRRKSIEDAFKPKGNKAMTAEQQQEMAKQLAELELNQPRKPAAPSITFSEPTAEGIFSHLKNNRPSAGLFSDEGISFFGGHGMSEESRGRTIGMLCHLKDGSPITRTRGGEHDYLAGRRLSAHLMLQPVIMSKVLQDPLLMEQGFMARFLIAQESTMAGSRFLSGRDPKNSLTSDLRITRYKKEMRRLLEVPLSIQDGELALRTLPIEGEAYSAWVALHDGVESELDPETGRYLTIRPFASKAAEDAARIAAVLAWVEGCDSISTSHIERAGQLIGYYLESMLAHTENATEDQQQLLASELLEWIRQRGGILESKSFKSLPSHLGRKSADLARSLLAELVESGHLMPSGQGRKGPTKWTLSAGGLL